MANFVSDSFYCPFKSRVYKSIDKHAEEGYRYCGSVESGDGSLDLVFRKVSDVKYVYLFDTFQYTNVKSCLKLCDSHNENGYRFVGSVQTYDGTTYIFEKEVKEDGISN